MLLHDLQLDGFDMPSFLPDATEYLTIMGSVAYGVSTDMSDMDVYGFAVPPVEHVFPHLTGYIHNFDPVPNTFKVFDPHKVKPKTEDGSDYDLAIYAITHYFRLLAGGNPNMVDSLFTRDEHVLHLGPVGKRVRDNRGLFLSQEVRTKYKGFAMQELQRVLRQKKPNSEKRAAMIAKHGYDIKAAYHVVRLLLEAEQMLLTGDMDLASNAAILREIRAGEWTIEQMQSFNDDMMVRLDVATEKTVLPQRPDMKALRRLLLECLEEKYGSLPDTF
jgi:uncharacterized protein